MGYGAKDKGIKRAIGAGLALLSLVTMVITTGACYSVKYLEVEKVIGTKKGKVREVIKTNRETVIFTREQPGRLEEKGIGGSKATLVSPDKTTTEIAPVFIPFSDIRLVKIDKSGPMAIPILMFLSVPIGIVIGPVKTLPVLILISFFL